MNLEDEELVTKPLKCREILKLWSEQIPALGPPWHVTQVVKRHADVSLVLRVGEIVTLHSVSNI